MKLTGSFRSAAKTISWRIIGSLDTFGLAFLLTGHVGAASGIASAEVLTKSVLYFLHERGWAKVPGPELVPVSVHH